MKTLFFIIGSLLFGSMANAQFPVVPIFPDPNVQYTPPTMYYYTYTPPQVYYAPVVVYPQYGASLFVNGVSIDRYRRTVRIPLNVNFSNVVYYDYPTFIIK
jgi:hypothetical protein